MAGNSTVRRIGLPWASRPSTSIRPAVWLLYAGVWNMSGRSSIPRSGFSSSQPAMASASTPMASSLRMGDPLGDAAQLDLLGPAVLQLAVERVDGVALAAGGQDQAEQVIAGARIGVGAGQRRELAGMEAAQQVDQRAGQQRGLQDRHHPEHRAV